MSDLLKRVPAGQQQRISIPGWLQLVLVACAIVAGGVSPVPASAAPVSLSLSAGYNRSNYGLDSYSWTRTLSGAVGLMVFPISELEVSYQDSLTRTHIVDYQDTSYHDQVYSLNWVQSVFPRRFFIQPFVKAGIGQLNREAFGSYANGARPPSRIDSVTGVLGAGLKIFFGRIIAIRTEATSYVDGGDFRTWQDNISITAGISLEL